jgi:hypothetical protein
MFCCLAMISSQEAINFDADPRDQITSLFLGCLPAITTNAARFDRGVVNQQLLIFARLLL